MSGGRPIVCSWCDRVVTSALPLFANGRGWTTCCDDCLDVIAPIEAVPFFGRLGPIIPAGAPPGEG